MFEKRGKKVTAIKSEQGSLIIGSNSYELCNLVIWANEDSSDYTKGAAGLKGVKFDDFDEIEDSSKENAQVEFSYEKKKYKIEIQGFSTVRPAPDPKQGIMKINFNVTKGLEEVEGTSCQ
jgi:hypothetical protein